MKSMSQNPKPIYLDWKCYNITLSSNLFFLFFFSFRRKIKTRVWFDGGGEHCATIRKIGGLGFNYDPLLDSLSTELQILWIVIARLSQLNYAIFISLHLLPLCIWSSSASSPGSSLQFKALFGINFVANSKLIGELEPISCGFDLMFFVSLFVFFF